MKNFGKIKHAYAKLMVEAFIQDKPEFKESYKIFVETVKRNPILKKQQQVFNNLANLSDIVDKDEFINECLSSISSSDRQNFLRENVILCKKLHDLNVSLEDEYDLSALDESITKLIFNTSHSKEAILSKIDAKKVIKEHVSKPVKPKTSALIPTKSLYDSYQLKIKETYPTLSKIEFNIVESIMSNDINKQKEIYTLVLENCKEKVIKVTDSESRGLVMEKLNTMEYNESNFSEDILKLTELEKNLN